MEISLSGLISTAVRVFSSEDAGASSFIPVAGIMSLFNAFCIAYNALFIRSFFLDGSNCWSGQRATNVCSHMFYLSFDLFLLYKTYTLSLHSKVVLVAMTVILLHRIVWTVWDIIKSQGVWDDSAQNCEYVQYPTTGIGYNSADIISDSFCTLTAILLNYKSLVTGPVTDSIKVIVQENILRSFVVVTVNSFELYAATNWTDPYLTLLAFLIQNYTYARCLNAELFWIEARKTAAGQTTSMSTTGSQIAPAALRAPRRKERPQLRTRRISRNLPAFF
ncbi:hypothetical protein BCR33DRAFT_717683, partial [Rhizoclosmatium globosum]